ncbi:MAG: FAD-binding oxidoreductase [Alphaproteobacteria bacterium]|jgi:D-arginine dehydrogenase|nr:FAD-binding oxidoreductase [Alphaproteobacteria bacterium]MDP6517680.1 FAD-binding oxidoreductase [Alphaproteobacteria bacterium]
MNCEFLVVGAGIAGASAGYELSRHGSVVLLEREDRPAYHSTGRSAAFFTVNYGNRVIRALTEASRAFLSSPPDRFAAHPLMAARGVLTIARADQMETFEANLAEARKLTDEIAPVTVAEAHRMMPVLRPDYVAAAHFEAGQYMDVDLLHSGYLRALTGRGGKLVCGAEVRRIERVGGVWRATTPAGDFEAPILVDAAGAWADEIARMAGVRGVGLVPKRRTVIIFPGPEGVELNGAPMVIDVDEQFYFKPEAGKILASPADETPSPPCDARPEEIDIAVTVERIQRASRLRVARIEHSWAGLRSFVADKTLVIGPDPDTDGFLWLAGQGGYGIMTSPAAARAVAALATGGVWPGDLAAREVTAEHLAPGRPALAADRNASAP